MITTLSGISGSESVNEEIPKNKKKWKCMGYKRIRKDSVLEIIGIFFSEMLGTLIFVFLGCLGCAENIGIHNNLTINAISFGIASFIGTQIFYRGSGGHLNPSLTLAKLFFRTMKIYMVIIYCVAQCVGALIGFGFVKVVLPKGSLNNGSYEKHGLCTTVPNPKFTLFTYILVEFMMTTTLVLVACSMWDIRNKKNNHSNLKYSLTLFLLIQTGGNITGCSMNPARSLAPAVWNNSWNYHWIYWIVPLFSGIFGGYFYTRFYGPDCYRIHDTSD